MASSLGSARRQLLLEGDLEGDALMSGGERAPSPGTFAETRAALERKKRAGAGGGEGGGEGGAGAEVGTAQLALAPPPAGAAPGAAQGAAQAVRPSRGRTRGEAGQRPHAETPRRGSLSVGHGEASGGGVLALRTPQPGEPHENGDEERAAPPVHGEYLKMIIDMSASRDVQDAVDDPDDFQVIAPSP